MIYFLDTSALVKRYLNEKGSAYMRRVLETADALFYQSFLTPIEIMSALYRRQRARELAPEELSLLLKSYAVHSQEDYLLLPYSEMLVNVAGALIARHPLRALDALQLASVLQVRDGLSPDAPPPIFLCADDRLVAAARHEHLEAENPERTI